jgi:hypothetical protein
VNHFFFRRRVDLDLDLAAAPAAFKAASMTELAQTAQSVPRPGT